MNEPAKILQLPIKNFLKPTVEEVSEYIREKMNWPKSFSDYYAAKFHDFYQSKGWKVGNQGMKDWKACFRSQWQTIKDGKDEERLTSALRKERDKMASISPITTKEDQTTLYLNDILSQYAKHPTWVDNSTLIPIYDHLKSLKRTKNVFKLNPDEVKICRSMGPEKGKAQAVKFLMDRMIKSNEKFH